MASAIGPQTYLTTEELAALIKYDARTIRNCLKDAVLFEGVHYIRPFGGRKILFIREAIERDIGGNGLAASESSAEKSIDNIAPVISRKPDLAPTRRASRHKRNDIDLIPMAGGGVCHV